MLFEKKNCIKAVKILTKGETFLHKVKFNSS
jgi:hypothetical protein